MILYGISSTYGEFCGVKRKHEEHYGPGDNPFRIEKDTAKG